MEKYLGTRDQLNTGDIVLFSGTGPIASLAQWLSKTKWSHVGMIVCCDLGVLLWESDGLGEFEDIESGDEKKGVRLVSLSDRIKRFEGEVWARPLKDTECTAEMLAALAALRQEVRGRPYEKNAIQLMKAYYDGPFGQNTEELSSLFCSELVAEAYQRMGLLAEPPEGQPSDEYTPIDFSEERTLTLLKGKLGREFQLKG
jgi:hypothetical protein